jgi:leucyl-tRNA synthetase
VQPKTVNKKRETGMEYNFRDIEKKWQQNWTDNKVYQVPNDSDKPKFYVLDMFPYPSGAGLHVGHPLGYIASDIYARYKRLKGFNVLHPMGYDAFGLPAEQYAIEHGVHPAVSTEKNIATFRKQLDNIGFSFDWSREVRTSDPKYYKWTQWIFLQLFKSFYNRNTSKAEPIKNLVAAFEKEGNKNHPIPNAQFQVPGFNGNTFSAADWKSFDEKTRQAILMEYRIAYCGYGEVNWCEALGTVLANDEVVNGVSERGGYPVVKKKLRQWYLRITEYADRLLKGLETVDFSEAMKEMQSNWIGKSVGAEIDFAISLGEPVTELVDVQEEEHETHEFYETSISISEESLRVYTTRPDTIFGVDFMVVAPEHDLVERITTPEQKAAVEDYITYVKSRSERERMAEKKISGVFTGSYALNPFNGRQIPIWISEYVLAGYGTGAIMAVPCGDERDHKFAKHFNIPITNIIGDAYNGEEANSDKNLVFHNSDFLNGMHYERAFNLVIDKLEELGIGKARINYKMRDAAFSRQRYWGEPFPIKWVNGIAYPLDESELPLELPHVESYKPGPEGEGPLANIDDWKYQNVKLDQSGFSHPLYSSAGEGAGGEGALETNTMPGYAGSSWYFLRYMDPHNDATFCDKRISDYWNQVDLYVGGTEHAVGHLLYSRMWTKALYDLGLISFDEPFKRLLNQGMIGGKSFYLWYIYVVNPKTGNKEIRFIHDSNRDKFQQEYLELEKREKGLNKILDAHPIPYKFLDQEYRLTYEGFKKILDPSYTDFHIQKLKQKWFETDEVLDLDKEVEWKIDKDGARHIELQEVNDKMSKSKGNTVNPDDIVDKYGADTFRMYEMFLGPVEMSKPWDTKGIEGVHRFLKKLWRLFIDEQKGLIVTNDAPKAEELKVLHKTIKKIQEDTERFSFNTCVSGFMVCVNELTDLKCHKKDILQPLLILLAPYAPHVAEELYHQLKASQVSPEGGDLEGASVLDAAYPKFEEKYVVESTKEYPVSVNGKLRTTINIDLSAEQKKVEEIVLANPVVQKWLEGKQPKKIIFVKGKMVNVVV